jgi:hypothetical protein
MEVQATLLFQPPVNLRSYSKLFLYFWLMFLNVQKKTQPVRTYTNRKRTFNKNLFEYERGT